MPGYKAFSVAGCRAPLTASVLANAANFVLDLVLMFGLGLGAGGAALATTVSQYISCFVLYYMLVKRDMLRVSDAVRPPSMTHLMPLLKVTGPSGPGFFALSVSL